MIAPSILSADFARLGAEVEAGKDRALDQPGFGAEQPAHRPARIGPNVPRGQQVAVLVKPPLAQARPVADDPAGLQRAAQDHDAPVRPVAVDTSQDRGALVPLLGPVAAVATFQTVDEAITEANLATGSTRRILDHDQQRPRGQTGET